jgi:hypothetical protein
MVGFMPRNSTPGEKELEAVLATETVWTFSEMRNGVLY